MNDESNAKAAQHKKFVETARALGCDENEAAFREKLRVIARQKSKGRAEAGRQISAAQEVMLARRQRDRQDAGDAPCVALAPQCLVQQKARRLRRLARGADGEQHGDENLCCPGAQRHGAELRHVGL